MRMKKKIPSKTILLKKELRMSELKYRLFRISYFGFLGSISLLGLVIFLTYFGKLDFWTFIKSYLLLCSIVIVCGLYWMIYQSRLMKWYEEYQKQNVENLTLR